MENQPTKEELQQIAAQFRKPQGEQGLEISDIMNDGNYNMNIHSIAVLDAQENDSILEIGMGNGLFVKKIINADSNIKYTGCDYSELMIQEAARINLPYSEDGKCNFVLGSILDLPFEDKSFDKLLTINTFYFWDDYPKAISEIKRVLKDDGAFVLSVRPISNLNTNPATEFGFNKYDNSEILSMLSKHFETIEITQIKEPNIIWKEQEREMECVIFKCY